MSGYNRISAKNLGLLKLDNFCERCFWLQFQLWLNKTPYRFNPAALITRLDPFQKKLVAKYFESNKGVWPAWLDGFGEAVDLRDAKRMTLTDDDTGLELVGIPDLIFQFVDGDLGVVDCKTASYKEGNDPLLPMYEVQVSTYAYLLRQQGEKVSKAGFVYFEGDCGQISDEELPYADLVEPWGHNFQFHVTTHEIAIKPAKEIKALLKEVRRIYDLKKTPKPTEGCKNCALIATYDALLSNKGVLTQKDALATGSWTPNMNSPVPSVAELWDWSR